MRATILTALLLTACDVSDRVRHPVEIACPGGTPYTVWMPEGVWYAAYDAPEGGELIMETPNCYEG